MKYLEMRNQSEPYVTGICRDAICTLRSRRIFHPDRKSCYVDCLAMVSYAVRKSQKAGLEWVTRSLCR